MEGGPGLIHGGILSAAFDEVMGTTALLIGVPVVTGHLEIDYARPIPIDSSLRFTADVLGRQRRKVYLSAAAHIVGDAGELPVGPVATSRALFIGIDPREHFAKSVRTGKECAHDRSRPPSANELDRILEHRAIGGKGRMGGSISVHGSHCTSFRTYFL